MEDVSPLVTHFSRLVWLFANRPDEQEGHKAEVRRALMQLSSPAPTVQLRALSLASAEVLDSPDQAVTTSRDLAMRRVGHSVRQLEFEAAVPVRYVYEIAKVLASEPAHGDEGATFDEKVMGLFLTGVRSEENTSELQSPSN